MATSPTTIEISHSLGRDEAKRRLASRIGELPAHVPGGLAEVSATWPGPYRMALRVAAMGQTVDAAIEIEDRLVRVQLTLPLFLSMMASPIAALIRSKGEQLLLPDTRPD